MDIEVIDDGRMDRGSHRLLQVSIPVRVRQAVLVLMAASALVLTWRQAPAADPPPARVPSAPDPYQVAEQEAATAARLQALEARRAQIRAVPAAYRDAARRASVHSGGLVPAEFFLALAYNRSLYGALLTSAFGRGYAARGPVQWNSARFAAVAVPGHRDATRPLDSFLAVSVALRRAGATSSDDAFHLSLLLGATVDEARADAETYDLLTSTA